MEKTDVLRRIVSLLLFLTLITGLFVSLPLSISAEGEGLQGGQSNIVNGSFEYPALRADDTQNDTIVGDGWENVVYDKPAYDQNQLGWKTTATNKKIEFAWLKNTDVAANMSPHMQPTIAKASYTADGYQLAEVIAGETNSSLYQKITVTESANYNWTVHHRGRSGVDTLALIITDDAGSVYDKSKSGAIDHFSQILNWLKNTNGVTAPADGETKTYTVYTTNLTNDASFEGEEANWFSYQQDGNHTVKFEIHLISTGVDRWGEYTGSYTSDENKDILFVLTSFKTSYSKDDGGNLIDKMSFVNESGTNLLLNPNFDAVNANADYKNFPAANAADPTAGIGWCTTAYARTVEIGNFEKGNAYGITSVSEVFNKPYIRDGEQFAELNADEESSLYQIVNTDPGKMYKWSLSHRGRDAIDTMALIIGPAQFDNNGNSISPKKTSTTARDQLMQIVDWLYSQTDMPLDLPIDGGCSDKIKVYTPKFNSNGGWTTDSNIFSFYKDSTHTEEWSVWVIASKNDKWHDYGELDTTAQYSYECVIPKGQNNTVFGFVSHASYKANGTKNSMSYGNLLDNIAFKEYYYAKVEVAMNNSHGNAYITSGEKDSFIWDDRSQLNGWALQGSSVTVHVKPKDRDFIGAYINGVFVPNNEGNTNWKFDSEKGEYYYTFSSVNSAINVNIIFSAQKIYYDSKCTNEYQYKEEIDAETGNKSYTGGPEVPMSSGNITEYESRAPEADDGWKFVGWKYINPKDSKETIFNAVHTVTLEGDGSENSPHTFTVTDTVTGGENTIEGISYDEGITFHGEWKYRQRVVAQTYNEEHSQYFASTEGGEVNIAVSYGVGDTATDYSENGNNVGKELYASADDTYVTATATYHTGFTFNGWYDSSGKLISKNASYVYKVNSGMIETLYAHFDPAGCDLRLNCSTYSSVSEDINKYFKIYCFLSDLRAGKSYTMSYVSNGVVSNETIVADSTGKATVTLNMKHGDYAMFIYLPVDSKYTIEADPTSSAGFGVKGEVKTEKTVTKPNGSAETIPVITEHIIFFKASQTALIKDGKHYEGIAEGEEITITKNSSYTFQVETKYNPSIYEGLRTSLCFYDANGDAKNFIDKTRILMIDLSNSAAPKYYSYTVNNESNGEINAILLTNFTELGSADTPFAPKAGDMLTEKLVFVVDYVNTGDSAVSGKVSLVYNDTNNELNSILSPAKKAVNIGEDNTGIIANAGHGTASSDGPFAMNITVGESAPAVNTTYEGSESGKYAVKLSLSSGKLPDGSYAVVGGKTYYSNNGYIKISPITTGSFNVNIHPPVPLELSDGKVKFTATLLSAVSTSAKVPAAISTEPIEYSCVDVAIDAEVSNKVLSPGNVRDAKITLKHKNLDEVKLTVSQKNSDGTYTEILTDVNVNLPDDNAEFTVNFSNAFNAESGKTYIFSFVGYVGSLPVCRDNCCVVCGYVLKNN